MRSAWDGSDSAIDLAHPLPGVTGGAPSWSQGQQNPTLSHTAAISHRLRAIHTLAWKAITATDDYCRLNACSAGPAATGLHLVP